MNTVKTLETYFVDKKIKQNEFTSKINDIEKYFDTIISDAKYYAQLVNGNINFERTKTTLYISYLDIPNSTLIDIIRMAV